MRDDAIYVTYHDEEGLAYIPFWRHMLLAARDRRTIKRLTAAVIVLAVALVVAIIL